VTSKIEISTSTTSSSSRASIIGAMKGPLFTSGRSLNDEAGDVMEVESPLQRPFKALEKGEMFYLEN